MTDTTAAALWDISGAGMYARNSFRLTELPTDSGRQAVLHRRQKIATMRQVDPDLASAEVLGAFDLILGDPRRRLVDEVLWLWDTSNADCGCPGGLHNDHDAAVRAHSAVLDHENAASEPSAADTAELKRLWVLAAQLWGQMLCRAAFWDHVRQRIAALDDRQLDDSSIDVLREVLPAVLVKPLVQLAVSDGQPWRAELAREWPAAKHAIDDQLEQAAGPLYDTVDQARTRARQLLDDGAPHKAAALIDEQEANLKRLKESVPPDRHRRTATALNAAAVVYNDCAFSLLEDEGIRAASTCETWYVSAHVWATSPQTIETIEENDSGLDELVRTVGGLQRQIEQLVATGRTRQAKKILLDLKGRLPPGTNFPDLDRMLAQLGVRVPPPSRGPAAVTIPARYRRRWFSFGGKVLMLAFVIVIVMVIFT